MNFLVDAQLPPSLARWIVSQGHQAKHVFDIGLETADDPVIWERARSESTVIISKNEDFIDRWLLSVDPDCASPLALWRGHERAVRGTAKWSSLSTSGKR